ncbi:TetR family transcriptional regulator [Pseudokineococcus basanitobsidens]|uniref:TetR family transcriptional regulator n=1 Tax=Pseudokineococcus basanitobsidens TaxID=1926649 RepID=A0ABU8RI95_9ACTN
MSSSMSSGVAVGRRERKKLETRARLESVALDLFEERGYDATTVEDVTESADVAVRTFFRYFPSKEALLVGPTGEALTALEAALDARPEGETPYVSVVAALRSLRGEALRAQEASVLRRLRLALVVPAARAGVLEAYQQWEGVLVRHLRRRRPDGDVLETRVVAAGVMAAFRVAVESWVEGGGGDDLDDLFDRAVERMGTGLADVTS